MSRNRRNEWLDADSSEGEDGEPGYDSEAAGDSRVSRAPKRRRISRDAQTERLSDDGNRDSDSEPIPDGDAILQETVKNHESAEKPRRKRDTSAEDDEDARSALPRAPPRLTTGRETKSKGQKTGVVYLSRVPPFMKPQTVKHLLSPYGEIGRIFLTPEDPASHSRRVKSGGNKKKSYTDGWVEFRKKKDAKLVAETLNAQIIGGKKGGWYHDDVWNIKYLKGFKWHHLTEQIANENAERAARLRTEIAQTTKENKRFIDNVERAKMLERMESKKKRRPIEDDGTYNASTDLKTGSEEAMPPKGARQNKPRPGQSIPRALDEPSSEVRRVLSKIF